MDVRANMGPDVTRHSGAQRKGQHFGKRPMGKRRSVREWFEGHLGTGNLGKRAVYKVLAASAQH